VRVTGNRGREPLPQRPERCFAQRFPTPFPHRIADQGECQVPSPAPAWHSTLFTVYTDLYSPYDTNNGSSATVPRVTAPGNCPSGNTPPAKAIGLWLSAFRSQLCRDSANLRVTHPRPPPTDSQPQQKPRFHLWTVARCATLPHTQAQPDNLHCAGDTCNCGQVSSALQSQQVETNVFP
jgi:hypothetical protein